MIKCMGQGRPFWRQEGMETKQIIARAIESLSLHAEGLSPEAIEARLVQWQLLKLSRRLDRLAATPIAETAGPMAVSG